MHSFLAETLTSPGVALFAVKKPGELSPASISMLLDRFQRAADVEPANPRWWLALLTTLGAKAEGKTRQIQIGQQLLMSASDHPERYATSSWKDVWILLEPLFPEKNFPLERWRILQMKPKDLVSPEQRQALKEMNTQLKKRRMEFQKLFQEALSRNDLQSAEFVITQLRLLDPDWIPLADMERRWNTVRTIQTLLVQVFAGLKEKQLDKARKCCQDILALDPNNLQAREAMKQIEELTRGPVTTAGGKPIAKVSEAQKKIFQETLEKAEKEEDLAIVVRTLKDLVFLGVATALQQQRLKEIETELLDSGKEVDQRWDEAQRLFKFFSWNELKRLLSRNPALANAERFQTLAEMRMMCNYYLGSKKTIELSEDAEALLRQFPQSFFARLVVMDIAVWNTEVEKAQKLFDELKKAQPKHPLLKTPGQILWLHNPGKKFLPFVILLLIYLFAKAMPFLLGWMEGLYWPWATILSSRAPTFALRSLENRVGRVRDQDLKVRLFELLTVAAFNTRNIEKGIRYGNLLLEMAPGNQVGIERLGGHYLNRPETFSQHHDMVVEFVKSHVQEKGILELFAKQVLTTRDIKPSMVPVLKRYLNQNPQDEKMIVLLGDVYRTWRVTEIGAEGLELLEKAWNLSKDDQLWQTLWKTLVVCGLRDRAIEQVTQALWSRNRDKSGKVAGKPGVRDEPADDGIGSGVGC